MRPPSIMSGKRARVYSYAKEYPLPPGNVSYNPIQQYRSSTVKPNNDYQTFSNWSLSIKSDLQSRTTVISHGEQYLPGVLSGEISLDGLVSSEGYMGYYAGQLVTVQLDWSQYFTSALADTKTIRIPVTISGIDRKASVKDAYQITINGKVNWIFDVGTAPQGWLVKEGAEEKKYGFIPTTPAIDVYSPASYPLLDSPYYA